MAGVQTSVPGSGYGSAYVDALIWGATAWDSASGPITFHFGETADYAVASGAHGGDIVTVESGALDPWSPAEKGAFRFALSLFASVSGLTFQETGSAADANIVWWQSPLGEGILGKHEIPAADGGQIWGAFSPSYTSWGFLATGGDGLYTVIHELGHALGLAHPHDGGGEADASLFQGVLGWGDTGDRRLNQSVGTVMSYNSIYDRGAGSDTEAFGRQGGLGAFDIAALQALYGRNMNTKTGDDVYRLPLANAIGTGWSSIWDAGGIDTISGEGSTTSVTIDLRAATLQKGAVGAGGFISQAGLIGGGFTIAKGVVIENAIGGSGNDRLVGNGAANLLDGGKGADRMNGGPGNDTYFVNTSRDAIIDPSGRDTISTSVSYTLTSVRIEELSAADPASRKAIALTGNPFANTITANAGANVVNGKGGNDYLTGGPGRDSFLFDTKLDSRTNVDRILDFSVRDDSIQLENSIFHAFQNTGRLASGAFHITKTSKLAHDADDRIIYNTSDGFLYYDADGIDGARAIRFARVDEGLKLKAGDFYLV